MPIGITDLAECELCKQCRQCRESCVYSAFFITGVCVSCSSVIVLNVPQVVKKHGVIVTSNVNRQAVFTVPVSGIGLSCSMTTQLNLG